MDFMFTHVRYRFAPTVSEEEQGFIRQVLSRGPSESQRILPAQSRVKDFYLVNIPTRPLFVKARTFSAWTRRLGRTLRGTKEEVEFRSYLALGERGIPCPEPLGVARQYSGLFVHKSYLLLEYLTDASPLSLLLIKGETAVGPLLDELISFLGALREKGLIHQDLQWNNIMVRTTASGHRLYLLDALHVRWAQGQPDKAFWQTLAWFVHFMMEEQAPHEMIEEFLDRVHALGLEGQQGRDWLLREARRMGRRA